MAVFRLHAGILYTGLLVQYKLLTSLKARYYILYKPSLYIGILTKEIIQIAKTMVRFSSVLFLFFSWVFNLFAGYLKKPIQAYLDKNVSL